MYWEVENKASLLLFVNEKAKIMSEPPFCTCLPPFFRRRQKESSIETSFAVNLQHPTVYHRIGKVSEEQQALYSCTRCYIQSNIFD